MTENVQLLEALRSVFQAEYDRRIVDPATAHAMVDCAREVERLAGIAADLSQPAEIRLEAASSALDLMGVSAKTVRYREHDPADLTLPELRNVLACIDLETEDRLVQVKAEFSRRGVAA